MSRSREAATLYAESLGIGKRKLLRLGGVERLQAMSEDARAILLKPPARAVTPCNRNLGALGMRKLVPGIVSRPPGDAYEVEWARRFRTPHPPPLIPPPVQYGDDGPMPELLMSDEMFDSPGRD